MTMTHAGPHDDESGFTLIEMVVAMVLLAVIAVAFLPLVTQASQAAANGTTLATATRLVSDQLETVRATPLTACPVISSDPAGTVIRTVTDPRGAELQTRARYEGPCTDPGIVRYIVTVTRSDAPTVPLAASTTIVMVGTA